MMRRLGLAIVVLLALVAPGLVWARSVTVRSGEHAGFSRVVVSGVDAGWTWQATPQGGELRAPDGVSFDLSQVFDLIPRTRLTEATAQGPVLSLTTAPGVSIAAERQGDIFVIDLGGQPGTIADPPQAEAPAPVLTPPADPAMRELGAITTLPGVGQTPQAASPQAQSIEQALLFRIAQAAGEGNLTVADRATLDALRRAGLVPPSAPTTAEAAPEEPTTLPAAQPPVVTCDAARLALTFPADAPDSIQGYEQAYLAMDRRDNDPGLVDLARGYLSLALPDEALAILSLRANADLPEARVLTAAAEALDQRASSDPALDLAALAECGPDVELWLLARPGNPPRRFEGYALFQSVLALPDPLRQAMTARLRQTLPPLQDSAAKTLLDLLAGLEPVCTAPCPAAEAPLGSAVLSLSQLDRASLTQQAQAVLLRLLNTTTPLGVETARHLDAMSFERRSEPGGILMRASALIAYARAGDFDTALTKLAAFTADDRHDPALTQAATAVATALAQSSTDAEFLRLAFAHATALASCCDQARAALEARLATHGFGPDGSAVPMPVAAAPAATAPPAPVDAIAAADRQIGEAVPAASAVAAETAAPGPQPAASPSPLPDGAPASAASGAGPSVAPAQAEATASQGSEPTPPQGSMAASTGQATPVAPTANAAETAASAATGATAQDSALVARSRDLTGASAALRSQVAASLAEVGLAAPQP